MNIEDRVDRIERAARAYRDRLLDPSVLRAGSVGHLDEVAAMRAFVNIMCELPTEVRRDA